jgi:hypothetical protein
MLDDVGDEHRLARQTDLSESLIEHPTSRPDERPSFLVLVIARLFADQHHASVWWALPEDGLRRPLPQVAGTAGAGRGT